MKSLFFTVISVYLFFCIVLFFFQRKLLYYPTPVANITSEKQVLFDVNGVKLHGWVINDKNEKALIYYGGNAESIELNINFFKTTLPSYSVYLINYRGYGQSEGSPSQNALFKDSLVIFDKLKQKYKSISIMGRSLGSGVASYVASKREIEKLALISPYDSVENVAKKVYSFFPVSLLLKDKFESYKMAKDIKAKTLVVYSKKDIVIPYENTLNLINHFQKEQIQTVEINEAEHNNIEMYNEYNKAISIFFNK